MDKIIEVLKNITPITQKDGEELLRIANTVHLKKGDFWIREGKSNHQIGMIERGYLRKFYVKDGNEITDYFYFENDFSADLPSIIGGNPPQASIVAMEDCTLIAFPFHDFNELCKTSPTLDHLYRLLLESTFLRFYKRSTSFILQGPKERYEELIHNNPNVFQRVAQYHIASYLGISPQHLSRLRGQKSIS